MTTTVFRVFWPWLIIGLICHLYENVKNKHPKISLSQNLHNTESVYKKSWFVNL